MTSENRSSSEICIIIPTFGRSDGLKEVIRSVFNQTIMKRDIRLMVIDNNPEPIEKTAVEELSKRHQHLIDYVHEPDAGVSNARNAAMSQLSEERYIAFIDDDMVVGPDWLEHLIATSKSFEAGLVFGPTHAVMPDVNDPRNKYLEPFFSRRFDITQDCLIEDTLGTGGCLLDLHYCNIPSPAFKTSLTRQAGKTIFSLITFGIQVPKLRIPLRQYLMKSCQKSVCVTIISGSEISDMAKAQHVFRQIADGWVCLASCILW